MSSNLRALVSLTAVLAAGSGLVAQSTTYCVSNVFGNRSIWISADGMDQRWRALEGATFVERADGTATYLGAIENTSDPSKRFSVQMDYSGRIDPGAANHPPAGSPYLNPFITSNLVSNGGTIDPATWRYYENLTGVFTGRLDYEGAVLNVTRRGPAFQVGVGANGKDLQFGGSGWFNVIIVSPPSTGVAFPTSMDRGDTNTGFDSNCPCVGGTTAMQGLYGNGLAGCNGVPALSINGDPLTNTNPRITIGNTGNMSMMCAMVWGINSANQFVPLLGGSLLVASPFAAVVPVTVPPGGFQFNCFIPDDCDQIGEQRYLQIVCVDPCGPSGFSLSRGLALTIGDL